MDLPACQRAVADFVDQRRLTDRVESRILDLLSEVGELAKEDLLSTQYGQEPFQPNEAWRDEMGDVVFSLICLANITGVDLSSALAAALTKYKERAMSSGAIDSGHNRGRRI